MAVKVWRFTVEVESPRKRDAVDALARITNALPKIKGQRVAAGPIYSTRKYRDRKDD